MIKKIHLLVILIFVPILGFTQKQIRIDDVILYTSEVKSGDAGYDNRKKYPITNIIDTDPKSAWVFEPDKRFENDNDPIAILIKFDKPKEIDAISLINGYAKSDYLYYANNIITNFKLIFSDKSSLAFNCKEQLNEQTFSFEPKRATWVVVLVQQYKKGKKYDDVCISELNLQFKAKKIINYPSKILIESSIAMYGSDKVIFPVLNKTIDLEEYSSMAINGFSYPDLSPDYKYILYGGGDDYCLYLIMNTRNSQILQLDSIFTRQYCPRYWTSNNSMYYIKMDENGYLQENEKFIYNIETKELRAISEPPLNKSVTCEVNMRLDEIIKITETNKE